jgi:hypothetical protein
VVTANNIFLRSLGSAVGVAVFGAMANATVGARNLRGGRVDPDLLTTAVQHIFLGVTIVAVLMLVMVAAMPGRERAGTTRTGTATPAAAA